MSRFKKGIALLLIFALASSAKITALAEELDSPSYSITINEYDAYIQIRSSTDEELCMNGYSNKTIEEVRSDAIENELTRLSNLSRSELIKLGYTSDQVYLIHNYNGERIENNPQLRGIFADMTCDFYNVSASTSRLRIKVKWSWTNAPLLAGPSISDIVAIRWQGTNTSGQPINLALNSSYSSCTIYHYSRSGSFKYSKSAAIETDDPYGHAYSKFKMSYNDGDTEGTYYAKEGSLIIAVDRTGTNNIKEGAFVFGYGHTIITVSPSISLPASFGIGFSGGVETMCEEAIRMSNNGTITEY